MLLTLTIKTGNIEISEIIYSGCSNGCLNLIDIMNNLISEQNYISTRGFKWILNKMEQNDNLSQENIYKWLCHLKKFRSDEIIDNHIKLLSNYY